jgi:hypothetical protein
MTGDFAREASVKAAILKSVCLLTVAACEAETPPAVRGARDQLGKVADRADKAIETAATGSEAPVCRRGERVIYACDFGDRQVAVCAAEDRLSYRFGDARRTDLEIDSRPGHVRAHVGGVTGGGGGRQDYIRFSNNGYQYIVHSMIAGSLTDIPDKRISGVTVVHGETGHSLIVRTLDCPQAGPVQHIENLHRLPEGTATPDEGETWAMWW